MLDIFPAPADIYHLKKRTSSDNVNVGDFDIAVVE